MMPSRAGGQPFALHLIICTCLALFCFSGISHAQTRGPDTVRIGVLAYKGKAQALRMWNPTAEFLRSYLKGPNVVIVPLGFDEIDPAVRDGQIDFIIANTSIYVALEAKHEVTRIATMENAGYKGYYTVFGGVIFCRTDRTDMRSLSDLSGKSFMAVDETSLGGWQAAWRELKAAGIDPHLDFRELSFAQNHNAVVEAVMTGKVDAGTVRTDTLERLADAGTIDLKDFQILNPQLGHKNFPFVLSTRLYPEWPIAKLPHTPEQISKMVVIGLLSMPPESPAARSASIHGWTTPLAYDPVHDLLRELQIGPYANYGQVTLGSLARKYWYIPLLIVVSFVLLASITLYILRLNRQLSQAKDEIEQARNGLEEQVRERTSELKQVISELFDEIAVREESERKLSQAEATFRTLVEQSLVGIYIIADGGFRYVNPRLAEIFGYKQDEIMASMSVRDLVAEEDRDLVAENIRRRLQGEIDVVRYSFRGRKKDGSMIHIEAHGSRTDLDGVPVVLGTLIDITEIKKAEMERENRLQFLQAVINSVSDPVMVIEPDYRVSLRNSAARRVSGKGFHCYEISHKIPAPCSDANCPCPLQEVLANKTPVTIIHTHPDDTGNGHTIEITAFPMFDDTGGVISIIEICRDITATLKEQERKKQLEERLFHEQKEESIATLAGGIAHDFNNILMSVLGNAELIKMRHHLTGEDARPVEAIVGSVERMSDLTRQLLAYARGGKYHVVTLHLAELIREAIDLTHKGKAKDTSVQLDLPRDLWQIDADAQQVVQVFVNILTNAFEAMEDGRGSLSIAASNVPGRDAWTCQHHDDHPAGDYVHIAITDTGPGISPEIASRVFDPFFTTKFLGRGLGLPAASGIIRNHGGCLFFEGSRGSGTAFHVYLPRAFQKELPGTERKAVRAVSDMRRILIVDDEPEILRVLSTGLREFGYDALTADSRKSIDAAFSSGTKIDVVVLDLQMPQFDGKELFRWMRTEHPDVRIIISTGYDEARTREELGQVQPDGFIQKPYRIGLLRDQIEQALAREPFRP